MSRHAKFASWQQLAALAANSTSTPLTTAPVAESVKKDVETKPEPLTEELVLNSPVKQLEPDDNIVEMPAPKKSKKTSENVV